MPKILYTVRTTLPSVALQSRYLAWLVPGHIAAVKAGGAESVRVVLPDRTSDHPAAAIEVHYVFPSRPSFDTYLREHAPALRADAISHFPPETGLISERQVGEIASVLE